MIKNEFIIKTNNLSFSIGDSKILKNVSLSVPKGSIYGFLGPNGAGKTTLIRILLNLYKVEQGKVFLFGEDVTLNRVNVLQRVGRFVEHPSLYGHLTGTENIIIAQKFYGVPRCRVEEVIDIVGMRNDCNRLVKTYSLGMKQRIAIALALVHNPELLILDEPTNGLDPSGIKEIRELLIKLNKEQGKTIFISSHLLSEIEKMCNQVGLIHHGEVLFLGEIDKLGASQSYGFEIRVSDVKLAQTILLKQGIKTTHNYNSTLSFVLESEKQTASINRFLVENGVDVYSVNSSQHNLEDVFMSLTNDKQTN